MKYCQVVGLVAGAGLMVAGMGTALGAEKLKSIGGSYKHALEVAGQDGKPLMIDFYTTWCPHCKEQDAAATKIPETMSRFTYYRVDAEQNRSLARQFNVSAYPTVVFVKPEGGEFHRWVGGYGKPDDLKRVLEDTLHKAGTIEAPKAAPARPATATAAGPVSPNEAAAAAQVKSALSIAKMGRKDIAAQQLQGVIDRYPNTQAAGEAKENLAQLNGKN